MPALLAAGLCLYELGTRSLWLDEAASAAIAGQHAGALASALARDGGNMLGYYGLLHVLIGAFGHGAIVLRAPSAIGAATAVALTGALAARLWDRVTAAVAGVLAAVSLTLVYWGQDARGYALMIALIAGSFLALVRLLGSESPNWRPWVAYVLLSIAAVYAGLEALLVLPAQLLVVAVYRRRVRAAVGALVLIGLCAIPLLVLAAERGSGQLFWVPAPSLRTAKQMLDALASSGLQPRYYAPSGNALLILSAAVALAGAALAAWRPRRGRHAEALVLAWLCVPPALDLVISLVGHSIFQARYVLVSLPAVALLLARTLARGWLLRTAWPRVIAALLLVALLTLRMLALGPSYGVSSEQWRGASAYVETARRTNDCIAFYPLDARMPFEYYGGPGRRLPRPVLPGLAWGVVRPYVEEYRTLTPGQIAALPTACKRVWLVSSHGGRPGGPPASRANFNRLQALRGELARRYPRRSTRRFGRASPVIVELFRGAA